MAVCEDHDPPFKLLSDCYFHELRVELSDGTVVEVNGALVLANRGGSKTFIVAVLHFLNATFKGAEGLQFGATEGQGKRCVAGDTPVDCPRDHRRYPLGIPISEIEVGQPVWTFNENTRRFELKPVVAIWRNGRRKVWSVTLDDGSVIRATSDHKFLKRDGAWVELRDLEVGNSLMPMYRDWEPLVRVNPDQPIGNTREFDHVVDFLFPKRDGLVVHHDDGSRSNNDPDNFVLLTPAEHMKIHQRARLSASRAGSVKGGESLRKRWEALSPEERAEESCRIRNGKPRQIQPKKQSVPIEQRFPDVTQLTEKKCADCGLVKPIEDFYTHRNRRKTRLMPNCRCKQCELIMGREARIRRNMPLVNHKIIAIEPGRVEAVFDITVADNHNYVTAGVVIHNCYEKIEDWCYKHDEFGRRLDTPHDFILGKPMRSETRWKTGGKVEVVAGSENAVSGPHPQVAGADEVDQMEEPVWVQSRGMAVAGKAKIPLPSFMVRFDGVIPPMDVVSSTMNSTQGKMKQLVDEHEADVKASTIPEHALFKWCIFETIQEVPHCRGADPEERRARLAELGRDPEELCPCNKVVKGVFKDPVTGDVTPRTLEKVCGGKAFRSRGFKPYVDFLQTFKRNTPGTWKLQHECRPGQDENAYIQDWSLAMYGVRNYEPKPEYGPIYCGYDWGGCYDAETEVLTRRGWVKWPDVKSDDEFASLDPSTQLVEWQQATEIIDKPYHGFMDRYQNKNIDLLVTSDHNMLVAGHHPKEGKQDIWRLKSSMDVSPTAKMLKTSNGLLGTVDEDFVLPGCGDLDDLIIDAADWAAILGFWMAEGHYEERRVGFTNYDEEYVAEIELILRRYFNVRNGIDFDACRGQLIVNDKRLAQHFRPLGKAWEKRLPGYVKTWSKELLWTYLEWHLRGDGCRNRIYTSSKGLADDLQEIAMYANMAADISVKPPPAQPVMIGDREIRSDREQYVVGLKLQYNLTPTIWSRRTGSCKTTVTPEQWGRQRVYCAVLPKHHTLYVRRNGKAIWCGNTNPAVCLWIQYLKVEVSSYDNNYEPIYLMPNTYVLFREAYVAGIDSAKFQVRCAQIENEYRARYGNAWRVKGRFMDPQGKDPRILFRRKGMGGSWPFVTRNKASMITIVQNLVIDDRFAVDSDQAPMFCEEIEGWGKKPGTDNELDKFNHAMSAWRYGVANAEVKEGNRVPGADGEYIGPDINSSVNPEDIPEEGRRGATVTVKKTTRRRDGRVVKGPLAFSSGDPHPTETFDAALQ